MKLNFAWLKPNRLLQFGMILLTLAIFVLLTSLAFQRSKVRYLTLAAGSPGGESYIVCTALSTVLERHYPTIKLRVLETGGTVESLKMIEDGQVQLAVAQADVLAGPSARILAVLYDDTFQLLTPRLSPVRSFAALRGKTIALPPSGGQLQSFLRVARHFGLQRADFHFIGDNDTSADQAFAEHHADALFRVRALGNPSIQRLIKTGEFHLVRIDHASAMKINHPDFDPTVIPAGAYSGSPAVPGEDLPSISVRRLLLAASWVDDETVRDITATLIDNRQEVAREIPDRDSEVRLLLAHTRRPEAQAGLGPALHPGAVKFYEKGKPSFILAHADYLGLMLTVLVMVSSWIWELRAWIQAKQKNISDEYSNQVVALINAAREAQSPAALEEIRGRLLGILTAAVSDLDADRLSEESFHSFRAILQIGLEVVRDSAATFRTREVAF